MTTVSLASFVGTELQRTFGLKGANLLQQIINAPAFLEKVQASSFSSRTFRDVDGRLIEADNATICKIIREGIEYKTPANNVVDLQVAIKKLRKRVVGLVNPPNPLITTNSMFFDRWVSSGDYVSVAAHWLHEWLHVAGFVHKGDAVDRKDVNYTVGRIAVSVGRELVRGMENEGLKVDLQGQGYLDGVEMQIEFLKDMLSPSLDISGSSQKSLQLGFVDLGGDVRPVAGKVYPIISAGNAQLETLPTPTSTLKALKLDILAFYNDNMPDFLGGKKEGLFKVSINTRNPQTPSSGESDVTVAVDFKVRDGQYAPSFLFKGVFRNVIFSDWINLRFDLFELDTDAEEYYNKVKGVVDTVPELRNLDILNGVPYLNLASKLFEGIIKTFGKNADDHMWNEMPTLEINPSIGGAFLRSGMYVIFQRENSKDEDVLFECLEYIDNRLQIRNNSIERMSNHMLLSIALSSSNS